jgi:twitching motility two-component system response regulator PilH
MTEKGRGRVLVIEDDRVASDLIVKTLLPRGIDVSVAASPDRGLEKAREDIPDLVFVSLFLPDSNGLKLSKRIHAIEGLGKVPVVMLISYKGELDPKYTSTIGVVDVIVKPLRPEEIIEKTTKVLGKDALSEEAVEHVSAEEEGTVEEGGSPSVWPAEEEEGPTADLRPGEGREAAEREERTEGDETEEFLREEAAEEVRIPAVQPGEDGTEQFPEETGPDSWSSAAFEEEMPDEAPRRFFAGRRLVIVSVICAALVLGVGAYGLKKILSKAEKTAESGKAPAAREVVPEAAGGPAVAGETKGKDADKGIPAKKREPRQEVVEKKKEIPAVANTGRSVRAPSPKESESAGKKGAATRKDYGFSVQVGAFGSEKNAASLAEKLRKRGYDSFVEKDDGRPIYRVLVGRFENAKKASVKAKALREDGLKTIVHRGKG